jgi:hypothetical protein
MLGGEDLEERRSARRAAGLRAFGDAFVIVRGQRSAPRRSARRRASNGASTTSACAWTATSMCSARTLKQNGRGVQHGADRLQRTTRIAFIKAPDGVSVELLNRK